VKYSTLQIRHVDGRTEEIEWKCDPAEGCVDWKYPDEEIDDADDYSIESSEGACCKHFPQLRADGFIHQARQVVEQFPALRGLLQVRQGLMLKVELRAVQKLLPPPMVADRAHIRPYYVRVSVKVVVELGDADYSIMPARRRKFCGSRRKIRLAKPGTLSVTIVDANEESESSPAAESLLKLKSHAAQKFQLAAVERKTATPDSSYQLVETAHRFSVKQPIAV